MFWLQDGKLQPLPSWPGVFLPPSLSVAGMMRVQVLEDQPCLVSWLRAPCHEGLLPSLPNAMSAPCRFPRANVIHTVMIVACLWPTIIRNPSRRYCQHTAEKCLKLCLLDKIALLWITLPLRSSVGSGFLTKVLIPVGVHLHCCSWAFPSQAAWLWPPRKRIVKLFRECAGKIQRVLPGASKQKKSGTWRSNPEA